LAKNPHSISASYNKGSALYDLGNYSGAIVSFDKVLAINPYDVEALTYKGLALGRLGNYTGAVQYYLNALINKGAALDNLNKTILEL
jgi:tetratricopeptide (TPR) repeat protein